MGLSEIIATGMNNPDCSFFVGSFFGQFSAVKGIITIGGVYIILKVLNNLVLEPCLKVIKRKLKLK